MRSSSTGTSTRSAPAPSVSVVPHADPTAPLGAPLLLLNLKAYTGCLGPGAMRMARSLEKLGQEHQVAVAIAAAAPDLGTLAEAVSIPVLAQHADNHPAGASTGWMVPESLLASGVQGSLLNHSEHPLEPLDMALTVERLTEVGLTPVVCAREEQEAALFAQTSRPPYLAVEPPELIGGKVSVSRARPDIISHSVLSVRRASPGTHVLCGAGVQDGEDVRIALELGAEGILVASAVTTSPDPEKALKTLLSGFSERR
ncbi:MAG: triose-phosphate isomerase [Euryarchaeota archaeon]|nr:triose-phosphate isomerase [Euryarchaeota archaeon]MDE1879115.1 triose-phosphate isomerase [Euryarchaeota archaeon]MDE2044287.1 triose-phosphate isomerase [Thermoplasmata archaeon]